MGKAWEIARRSVGYLLFGYAVFLLIYNLVHGKFGIIGPLFVAIIALWLVRGPKKIISAQRASKSRFKTYLEDHPRDKMLWRWANFLQWVSAALVFAWIMFILMVWPDAGNWIFFVAVLLCSPSIILSGIVILNRYKYDRARLKSL